MNRRQFVMTLVPGALAISTCKMAMASAEFVDAQSEPAKAVHYIADVSQLDPATNPTYKKGQRCDVCQLYSPIDGQANQGECGIFPGQAVSAIGWCAAYA